MLDEREVSSFVAGTTRYFEVAVGQPASMLMKMQESNVAHENLCDLVGEVANTITGNVRRDFGREFGISPPNVVSEGQSLPLPTGCHPIVIPINWRSHTAKIVVCLK